MRAAQVVTKLHGPDTIDVVNQAVLSQYFVTSHSIIVYALRLEIFCLRMAVAKRSKGTSVLALTSMPTLRHGLKLQLQLELLVLV